ncbi:MAG TPA: shikimate kinase [Terrimicrobiaceae bacterium]|nr:shikimate kinase [Terrimicrobiaceae bacterium]
MLPNLVLIGFMGSGKSSVGRRLSGLTGHRFVDVDELITQAEGRSIPEIFSQCGENLFRDLEQRVLEELVGVCGIVLSTGGGLVLRSANRETLKRIGIVAWLDADPEILFERAMRSGRRPLLQTEDPKATFDELLSVRRSLYELTSDFRVDSSRLSHDEVAQILLEEALRRYRRF